jgi:hypothetical protein
MVAIEALEGRTLFSGALSQTVLTDLSNLTSDIMSAKTAYQQYAPTLHADLQTLRADAKAASQRGGVLVAKLNAASLRFFNTTRAEALRVFVTDGVAARAGTEAALLLSTHPNNTRIQSALFGRLVGLNNRATAMLNKLGEAGNTLSTASASALGAVSTAYSGNANVSNDVSKLQSDGTAFLATVGPSLGAIQNDLPQLFTDVLGGK